MIDKTMCEVLWRNIYDFYVNFTSWSGETPTGNFSDLFLSWTRILSVLIGWPIKNTLIGWPIKNTLTPYGKKMHVKEIYVIFIHLFDSGILLIIDLNKKKGRGGGGENFICEFYS